MIQLPNLSLPPAAQAKLDQWQQEIDDLATYPERVAAAKKKFGNRNRKDNPTFSEVRTVLAQMCSGARRCGYCEDSVADEVEHIKPKDLYPNAVFAWRNYLYACGPCNGKKNNQFAVFATTNGEFTEVTRKSNNHKENEPVEPPIAGEPVLINPREENPLNFLLLDLQGTFFFLPRYDLNPQQQQRARFTIDVLSLNKHDHLLTARANAYQNYLSHLYRYVNEQQAGKSKAELESVVNAIKNSAHPTVWREMQRQYPLLPKLKSLFEAAPEALTW